MLSAVKSQGPVITSLPSRKYTPFELVEGLKARDQLVCAAFFAQHAKQINRLVMRFLGPDQDHVDVVNNAFVQILSSIDKLRDPQALTLWISSVTVQTVHRELRSRKYRRKFLFFTDVPEDHVSADWNQGTDLSRQLFRILRKFPPEEYVHFVLYYMERNTYEEIAELTNCSLTTAKRRGKSCKQRFLAQVKVDQMFSKVIEEWKSA